LLFSSLSIYQSKNNHFIMKKIFLFLVLLTGLNLRSFAQDDSMIRETLNNYLEGGTNGDTARLRKAFHPGALQRSLSKDNRLQDTPVAKFLAGAKVGQKMERTTKIVSYSYIGNAATAVVESEYEAFKYVDLLNLLKFGSEWKIVSRVFSRADIGQQIQGSGGGSNSYSTTQSQPAASPLGKTTSATPAKKATKPAPKASDDGW
jgi:Putative lumazine-binding